jgi:thiamine-phosphate pyrophosphorylase
LFLIVGHIFETDCKKGLKPRGTDFLKEICDNVNLPVFAIGGINEHTIKHLQDINIEGVCLMSGLMKKITK